MVQEPLEFMSTPIFKLEITKEYVDLPLLRQKDKYLVIRFVEGGFRDTDKKALNFVRKFLKTVTLTDITMTNGTQIFI